jgi:predicted amidohydrolase
MTTNRRKFLSTLAAGTAAGPLWASMNSKESPAAGTAVSARKIPIALVQSDSVAGQIEKNLDNMERLVEQAAKGGAKWIQFHELTVCDYVDKAGEIAEAVPEGRSTARMIHLAKRLGVMIAFSLAEKDRDRLYDSLVFVGPQGYLHRYHKTWLWRQANDLEYRDEWARYDPGRGPELFHVDGLRATCFICADCHSKRCIQRAAALKPQVVFFPINKRLSVTTDYVKIAKTIGAPLLVSNRVGRSVTHETLGGSMVFSAQGEILARANVEGREEILHHNLEIPSA